MGAGVDGPNIPAGAGVPCECKCESPMAALDPRFGAGDIRACCKQKIVLMNPITYTNFFKANKILS
jgi:hypothetical protein